jgi:hypothetical protein
MERAVIYKNSTPAFLGNELTVFSGIAVSAPELSDPYYDYYMDLRWNIDTGMGKRGKHW